jgi:hypothetical protein
MPTFDEYINNPMGGKSAVFTQREMYRNMYTQKLDAILLREAGKIDYYLYKDKDTYIAHVKVPSEVVPKFYYDTVIEFSPTGVNSGLSRTLNNEYSVRFYSNDPAFVFTFAHAFIKNDLFFKDLEPKMSKLAVKNTATERNPQNQIGYVKSLYFAYLWMKRAGLFNKLKFDAEAKRYSKRAILSTIEHADKKINDRQEKEAEIHKKNRIEKSKEIAKKNAEREYKPDGNLKASGKSKAIGTVKSVKTTKRSSTVKKV